MIPDDDTLRSILHAATHNGLPVAKGLERRRAEIQVAICEYAIGALRAWQHGANSFDDLYFHRDTV